MTKYTTCWWVVAVCAGLGGCEPKERVVTPGPPTRGGGKGGDRFADSPRARATLERLQERFKVDAPIEEAAPGLAKPRKRRSGLPPADAEGFDRDGTLLRPRISGRPRRELTKQTQVLLPLDARGAMQLADQESGVSIKVTLDGMRTAEATAAGGYLVYPGAHGTNADLLRRAHENGVEDYLAFEQAPATPEVSYDVALGDRVAGVRLVSNTLELLDAKGAPRLRMANPYLVTADGKRVPAHITVARCAVDTNAAGPWNRRVTPPGARACTVKVAWNGAAVTYPALLDPPWSSTGVMVSWRQDHTATLLASPSTQVLIAGGDDGNAIRECELFDPGSLTFASTSPMRTARRRHTAVLLTDGRVLVAGGMTASPPPGAITGLAELFSGGSWTDAAPMQPRYYHTATLVAGGQVLHVGGSSGSVNVREAQLYTPGASGTPGAWSNGGTLNTARSCHTATLLAGGDVLVAKGNEGSLLFSDYERWSNSSHVFRAIADPFATRRILHTASLVTIAGPSPGPRVLIAGGGTDPTVALSSQLYDPATDGIVTGPAFLASHQFSQAVVLQDGRVVVTGGGTTPGNRNAEILDPRTSPMSWAPSGQLVRARNGSHSFTLLRDGRALVAGGNIAFPDSAEIFDTRGIGSPCTTNADCSSAFCIQGACCADACSCRTINPTCDDGNACTIDHCFPALGCRNIERSRCGDATLPAGGAYCDLKTRFPTCPAILDTDGDGLSDAWEDQQGVDVNCDGAIDAVNDVQLTGANKNRPSIFVHFDYMEKAGAGNVCTTDADCTAVPGESCIPQTGGGVCTHSHKPWEIPTAVSPNKNSIARVVAAFAAKGADLIIDPRHDRIPEVDVLTFADPLTPGFAACAGTSAINFHSLKGAHFAPATVTAAARDQWKNAWHYGIFAHHNTCPPDPGFNNLFCGACPPDRNGVQPFEGASGTGEYPGNDFIVSLGDLYFNSGVARHEFNEGGTLMHEIGHNLNLHHNGDSPIPENSPSYLSIMNYAYQFNGIRVATASGYPITLNPAAQRIDYSPYPRIQLTVLNEPTLDENTPVRTGTLDVVRFFDSTGTPTIGPSNSQIDWDGLNDPVSGNPINTAPVSVDLNNDDLSAAPPRPPSSVFSSFGDWDKTGAVFTNLGMDFQCRPWGMADGAAPLHNQARGELSPRHAAKLHVLYPERTVSIDVRPKCATNWLAAKAPGTVPVAVLGVKLDVTQIDVASLRFAGIKPQSTAVVDVNGDGAKDLLAEVPMAALIAGSQTRLEKMTGFLKNSQTIVGWDKVSVVPTPGPALVMKPLKDGFSVKLWPPNTQYARFTLDQCVASATDRCGTPLALGSAARITKITSDELDTSSGTTVDMRITGRISAELRREREGNGDGRVYTVYFTVTDPTNNVTASSCRLQVPRDQHTGPATDSGAKACVGTCP